MADRARIPRGIVPADGGRKVMNALRPGPIRTPSARGRTSVAQPKAFSRWNPGVRAAVQPGDGVITCYDVIGEDLWGDGGVTVNRIDAALRKIGNNAVEVHINSPGGDVFEGIAIANRLQQHPAKVTVKVMGLAASAASVVAMAGDEVQIAPSAFIMIHNCWVMASGDRNDMAETAAFLAPFDAALADVYAARSGLPKDEIATMLDAETWMNGSQAVAKGFADGLLNADDIKEDETQAANASAHQDLRATEAALICAGMRRDLVRAHLDDLRGHAPSPAPPNGDSSWLGAAAELIQAIRA